MSCCGPSEGLDPFYGSCGGGTAYGALRVNERAWQKLAPAGGNVEIATTATAVALEVAGEALREPPSTTNGPEP
jgi:hypothetical protein